MCVSMASDSSDFSILVQWGEVTRVSNLSFFLPAPCLKTTKKDENISPSNSNPMTGKNLFFFFLVASGRVYDNFSWLENFRTQFRAKHTFKPNNL